MSNPNALQTAVAPSEGLTKRSFLAILYAAVVMQPFLIYLSFVSGLYITSASIYITTLLFTELSRIYERPLRKQEVFIIYTMSSLAASYRFNLPFLAYMRASPISQAFHINGASVAELIPRWAAPPINSQAIINRLILHADWLMPIFVIVLFSTAVTLMTDLALGLLAAQIYIDVENLPFPLQRVATSAIVTLSERQTDQLRLFIMTTLIGIAYGFILYGIPSVTGIIFGASMTLIPVPWVDLTGYVERYLPGTVFAIGTDLTPYGNGLVIPFSVSLSAFIASLAIYFFGNYILVEYLGIIQKGIDWFPNLSMTGVMMRSLLKFWASPIVGMAIAVGLVPIVLNYRYLLRAIQSLRKIPEAARRAGYLPFHILIGLFIAGTMASIAFTAYLVPEFAMSYPWLLFLLSPAWVFIGTLVSARAVAEAGTGLTIPYLKEMSLSATAYRPVDVYYAPLNMSTGGAEWCAMIKIAKLTETKISSLYKAFIITIIIVIVTNILFSQAFLLMAPIPSTVFPYTAAMWPIDVMYSCLWYTKQMVQASPFLMAGGFAVGAAISLISRLPIPFSAIGFIVGSTPGMPIPWTLSWFIGGLVSKYFIIPRFGKEWYDKNIFAIVAGFACGEGIAVGFTATLALISKATWVLPY